MINRYEFPDSAMLASCEYNSVDKELTVTFKNGRDYIYVDVEKQIYDDLVDAPSAGRYFNSIKSQLKQKAPK